MTSTKKLIFDEPARVALSRTSGKIVAFGQAAMDLSALGAADIQVHSLFRDGVPLDVDLCREYLLWMRDTFTTTRLRRFLPYAVIPVVAVDFPKPYADLFEVALRASHFFPLQSRKAILGDAWVGFGASSQHEASLIIRMGATQVQIAQLSHGVLVASQTLNRGGDELDRALVRYIRVTKKMSVPLSMCTSLKEAYTKAQFGKMQFSIVVRGKHIDTSEILSLNLQESDVRELFATFFEDISQAVAYSLAHNFHFIPGQSPERLFLSGGLSQIGRAHV